MAPDLQTEDVELSVTGAGKADITATNSLQAAITGAGKVVYGGSPKSVEQKRSPARAKSSRATSNSGLEGCRRPETPG